MLGCCNQILTMKYLNYTIIYLMLLVLICACKFSDSSQTRSLSNAETCEVLSTQMGDSITVDTVIGDFKVFYRVSEHIDTALVPLTCNEDISMQEVPKIDRSVLINIQRSDSTSIVAYETINIFDFECVIGDVRDQDYQLQSFSLKEVGQNSIIFGAKLCMFGTDICKDVDIFIDKNGTLNYFLLN